MSQGKASAWHGQCSRSEEVDIILPAGKRAVEEPWTGQPGPPRGQGGQTGLGAGQLAILMPLSRTLPLPPGGLEPTALLYQPPAIAGI